MIIKIFLFILGIIITSLSSMFIIMYANLLTMGYTISEYLFFILRRLECLIIIIGIILIIISLYKRKEKNKNDFYL